jgi:ankyrin repeat protein
MVDLDPDKFLDRDLDSENEELTTGQALYQFVNSVDSDFSTPLIYSLRNKKNQIVKLLLKCEKVSLQQFSMKFGTPLHVAISNKDFKNGHKILKMLKS